MADDGTDRWLTGVCRGDILGAAGTGREGSVSAGAGKYHGICAVAGGTAGTAGTLRRCGTDRHSP